uniref:Uncharacterized protein n=1 Tax=Cucumis melo TaxID=3656 RepID=A0A9I9EEP4_CUCME
MFSCDFVEISIDYMTEILSLRLYGTVCTQVEIELPVPNTLPTSAESSRSNSSTWLELLFYKPSDVRTASRVCWEGFRGFRCVVFHVEYSISKIVGSTGIVRGDDVCWLHAVFRAKTAGGPGGGQDIRAFSMTYSINSTGIKVRLLYTGRSLSASQQLGLTLELRTESITTRKLRFPDAQRRQEICEKVSENSFLTHKSTSGSKSRKISQERISRCTK